MIHEVIYKLVRKSTSLRKGKKKRKKEKSLLLPRSFHVRTPSRTLGFIIWFFLKSQVVIRSSGTFPQGLCSRFGLPAFVRISKSLENPGDEGSLRSLQRVSRRQRW